MEEEDGQQEGRQWDPSVRERKRRRKNWWG
jgi:hypothetical protein